MDIEKIKTNAKNINASAKYCGCIGMNPEKITEFMAQMLGIIQASAEILKECEDDGRQADK